MNINAQAALFSLLAAMGLISFSSDKKSLDEVEVEGGLISGTKNVGRDIHIFKGIPFAAPPVGQLRWKMPQPVLPWKGVRQCTAFGPSPMQPDPVPMMMWSEEFLIPKDPISEDCLYLNVWTGAKSSNEARPVIVWIYGGGFGTGGSAVPIYDGEAMAKKGIVFVSINYRVGVFGFFAHPELTKESGLNASGNYGLMDQLAALRWVQHNIASFGGDPHNVTIAGESAGSISVNALVASPLGKGLFQKAIAESGASFIIPMMTLAEAEVEGAKIGESLKAGSLTELRNIPAGDLLKNTMPYRSLIVDGYVLPSSIASIFSKGINNHVSLLTGWNEDEGIIWGPVKKAEDFRMEASGKYGGDAGKFLAFYPAATDSQASVSQSRLSRDMVAGVENYSWANVQSDQGSRVCVYRFTHKVPGAGAAAKYGAFHASEIAYAYDNLRFANRPWAGADWEMAAMISGYWANFATSGDPNGKGLLEWRSYDTKEKQIMILDYPPTAGKLPDAAALDFLASKMTGG